MRALLPWACFVIGWLAGCTAYHARPIEPEHTAAAFETRTLESPELREYLETNLQRKGTTWPPQAWDFTMLTLAAFYYHPDLDLARAQWGVARAGRITAGELPNPTASFFPQYATNPSPGVSPWVLSFTLDVPIETAGKRGYRKTRAQCLSESARLNIGTVAWAVRSRLRSRYLDLYAAEQTLAVLEKQVAILREEESLLQKRLDAGESSRPDLLLARILLHRTRVGLQQEQERKVESRGRFAAAMGLSEAALNGTHFSFETLEQLPPPENLPSKEVQREALLGRTDILASLADYAAAQSALQLEIAKQVPDLVLGPGYEFDQGQNKWGIGISLVLPVLNQNQGPIAEARARRREAGARFIALQARVIGEIETAAAAYRVSDRTLETADALLSEQKGYAQSVQAMVEQGESDRLALLGAEADLTLSELSRLKALVDAQKTLGLLEDAVQRPLCPEVPWRWPAIESGPRPGE